ncbi:amidohydrolase [Novosphingobium rosa]|uniref:amidohydrolase n=1 Tax=Novosphingobium rosa TaxID=76978 RepID=UPI000834B8A0|nr:amidohydrolase [Novosphingobium rosa]
MRFRVLTAALLATVLPVQAHADALIDHVRGFTLDDHGEIQHFSGLVIDKDGRVKQLLRDGDTRPTKLDFLTDGHDAVMMPGLIDAHAHVMGIGFNALTLDLSDTRSLADAQTKIAAYAAKYPGRPWIIGSGWNQETWGLGRFPTAAELDAAVSDRPVWLERVDGHAGWANSRALALAGITAATKDPAGGHIERLAAPAPAPSRPARPGAKPAPRAALAAPAGVLVDAATALMAKAVPPPRPEDRDLALSTAQTILLRHGVTAAADMGTSVEDWQTFRRAGDLGRLRIRIMAYALGTDAMALIGGPGPTPWLYDDRLRMNGVKLFLDGALGSRGAWLKAPYADAPNTTGLPQLNDAALKNLMSRAAMDHFQVAVHAIGDAANSEVLDAITEMADTYKGDRRWRIEHAQIIAPEDFPRIADLDKRAGHIILSMQPTHETSDRLMAEARLGPARLAGAYAWKSAAATGATLAFGSDAPVEVSDPFAGMAAAISRVGADGQPAGGWQPQEVVSRTQALAGYTVKAAYAGFAEDHFGRLTPGQHADFLLVDRDVMTVPPAEIRGTKVLQVWVGGLPVFKADEEKK